jgi:hypothetical protein
MVITLWQPIYMLLLEILISYPLTLTLLIIIIHFPLSIRYDPILWFLKILEVYPSRFEIHDPKTFQGTVKQALGNTFNMTNYLVFVLELPDRRVQLTHYIFIYI